MRIVEVMSNTTTQETENMSKDYIASYRSLEDARMHYPDSVHDAQRSLERIQDLEKELKSLKETHDVQYMAMYRSILKNWTQGEFEKAFGSRQIEMLQYESIAKTADLRK